jgi:hypothetical protein
MTRIPEIEHDERAEDPADRLAGSAAWAERFLEHVIGNRADRFMVWCVRAILAETRQG